MRKVKFFANHSDMHVRGFGTLGTVLPGEKRNLIDLDMQYAPNEGIYVTFKGRSTATGIEQLHEVLVPATNIKIIEFEPQENKS